MALIGIDASRSVSGQRTGTEAYATFLLQALVPLALARQHKLRLYFNREPLAGSPIPPGAVESVTIPWPRLWTHLRLGWELQRRPPEVFFTPAHVIPWSYRGASVATVHDLGFRHFPQTHPWRQRRYLEWSTRHNARRARIVIADSEATRRDLESAYALDSASVEVIYPAGDPHLGVVADRDRVAAACQKYGIVPPYLLALGTIQPRKNLPRLIQAFAASQADMQLVLAGKQGWLAEEFTGALEQLPAAIRARVTLPGFVEDEDKAALLSGATALLFPSLYEGFGFPVLEAQICDTAVVCANSSSLPEVAGEAALFVDPLDVAGIAVAIQRIVQDRELRQSLVERGRRNARRFSWGKTAEAVLAVLEEVASGKWEVGK